MKMNRPEMEVVRFEVADVIATSGEHSNCFQYFSFTDKETGVVTPELWGCPENISGAADVSAFDPSGAEEGTYFDYDGGSWVPCQHHH